MKAYVVEDQYRNNQVLVYALNVEDARTAASNKKEFCEIEWADLLVKRAEYADGTDHLSAWEAWEIIGFRLAVKLNKLVNGRSFEIVKDRLYEDNWKDLLNSLDSKQKNNILTALNQLITDNQLEGPIIPESYYFAKKLEEKGYKIRVFDENDMPQATSFSFLDLLEKDTMKTKIYKTDFSYTAIIQAESKEKALELYRNEISYIGKYEEGDFISSLKILSLREAVDEMKLFILTPEELERLGKEYVNKRIEEDSNQILIMEYP